MFITGVCRFVNLFSCDAATKTPPCISRMFLNTHRMSINTRSETVYVLMAGNSCELRNVTPKTRLLLFAPKSCYASCLNVFLSVLLCVSVAVGWMENMRNGWL
jgi:hypothetical protein